MDLHFRLDEHDLRGRIALEVLATWEQQGYPVDEILVRALLMLGEHQRAQQASTTLASVRDIIRQMRDLLREAQSLGVAGAGAASAGPAQPETASGESELSQAFLAAIKKTARPGLRLET